MIPGIIERSCIEGQKTFHKDLATAIKLYISSHASDFAIEGAEIVQESEEDIKADLDTNQSEDSTLLSTLIEFITSPMALIGLVITLLLLSNVYTLLSLRSTKKLLNTTRMGSPIEVVSAVNRVLNSFSKTYSETNKNQIGVNEVLRIELKDIMKGLERIDGDLNSMMDRVKGLLGSVDI